MSFDADFAASNDLLAEAFGGEVSLVRSGATTEGVIGQLLLNTYSGENNEGITITVQMTDFVIARKDYQFGEGPVEPRKGDRITKQIAGVENTFEVTPAPDGRAVEWADPGGDEWLIHTRRVGP